MQNWVICLKRCSLPNDIHAGRVSDKIFLSRRCCQGDPISPYLYVITALFDKELKISHYADDD